MTRRIGYITERLRDFQAPCPVCGTWNTPWRIESDGEHLECWYRCGMWDRQLGCGELYDWTDPEFASETEDKTEAD